MGISKGSGHKPISLREISLREVLSLESRLLQPIRKWNLDLWKCWILICGMFGDALLA